MPLCWSWRIRERNVAAIARVRDFFAEEWLLSLSVTGFVALMLYTRSFPACQASQLIPIFLLWVLFVAVKGIEESGYLHRIAVHLEAGRMLAPKLVAATFVLSVVLTIDVTLVTLLPLVLSLRIREKNALVLLVAFTAHVGAALTPFGTPQNLFIFSFYEVTVSEFIRVIAPFSFGLFVLFLVVSFFIRCTPCEHEVRSESAEQDFQQALLYTLLLLIGVLAVLRVCPWYAGGIVLLSALVWHPKLLLRVDYPLLVTFILFLGITNMAKGVLSHTLEHPVHLFVLSSLLSQIISNVPTTLLLHSFTARWEALLWGTNVGGFGTPVAALANLIAYRIYMAHTPREAHGRFLWQMLFWGVVVYGAGAGLYLLRLHGV